MLRKINQCDIYVGMWCIYMLQGVLYSPGIINQLLQLIMLLWSMIAVFKHLFQHTEHSSILKATLILIAMYTIYGGINVLFGDSIMVNGLYVYGQYVYVQTALNSLAPIFLFYYFTKNGQLKSERIMVYLPILLVTCILLYYKNESLVLLETNKEEITNNAGYHFVSLIPILFFYSKRPLLQYVLMAIILLYAFMGMKRGAILIGVLCSIMLLYANMKNSARRTKMLYLILSVVILIGLNRLVGYMMSSSEYFLLRFEQTLDGDASGRDIIYGNLWNELLSETSPFYFYFGRGADSTLKVIGNFAHQDWLETFCNNGLIGVFILFFFFFTLGRNAWRSRMYFPGMIYHSFVVLFIIIFSKTLFSMSIQSLDLVESMLLGFFAFKLNNFEQNDIYETDDSINDCYC